MQQFFDILGTGLENSSKRVAYINARLIDPESGLDSKGALLTEGSMILDLGPQLFADGTIPDGIEVVDCGGHALLPGLIDIQVHFREPGQGHKETIATGSRSAAAGGVTLVVCQPNTQPTIDSVPIFEYVKNRARETSAIHIRTYASITKGLGGNELTDMGKLVEAGAVGFTDDGLPVMNALIQRRAMMIAKTLGVPIAQHAEDLNLSQGGCMNEGLVSTKLGVIGIPNVSESVIVERDIALCRLTGAKYHVLHVSTKEAMRAIRRAKAEGLPVTCEVAPHHFTLTDEAVIDYKTFAKMNPPLRSEEDRMALIEALKDGTVDAIATDHAPHDQESKRVPLSDAAFGIVGLETLLPLSLELHYNYGMSLRDIFAKLTYQAADIISEKRGRLKKGYPADLSLIDLTHEWVIDPEAFASKSKNSPFSDRKVKGRAIRTVAAGKTVYRLER